MLAGLFSFDADLSILEVLLVLVQINQSTLDGHFSFAADSFCANTRIFRKIWPYFDMQTLLNRCSLIRAGGCAPEMARDVEICALE